MLMSPALLAGAGASVATPVIMAMAKALGIGGDDPEEELYAWAEEVFGSDAPFRHGFAGLFGVNLKGSLSVNNPFPATVPEIFGAPGGIFTDIKRGVKSYRRGEYLKAAESVLPSAFGNLARATREASEGVTTGSYSPVYYGDEPLKADAVDTVLRVLSFSPSETSGIREKQWRERKVAAKYADRKGEIYARFKRYYIQESEGRDAGEYAELMKMVEDFNNDLRASGRADISMITGDSVRTSVKGAMRPNKRERMRATPENGEE